MHAPPRLLVLAGATASGKTAAALTLARALDGELVGADSVQVYRRLDIGSAKPRPAELLGVAHHLLDLVDLDTHYDASRYVADADAAIAEVRGRGRVPIVVGGTGLYLRALVYGLAPDIPSDPTLRASLNARAAGGVAALRAMHAELTRVDPDYAVSIAPTDPIRIVRALEVHALTGVAYSAHHRQHQAMPPRYDARFYALEVDREALRARIAARAADMLRGGWVDEVRAILADGYDPSLKPLRAVGYAQVVAHLQGALAAEALLPAVITATAQFAKRQRTWFRGERAVRWTTVDALTREETVATLRDFVAGNSSGDGGNSPPGGWVEVELRGPG
ncbi:MAG: tRNA (adenosine(37)-N6)-dimethylallyltransferase MiaA [Polyangiales bacterium]